MKDMNDIWTYDMWYELEAQDKKALKEWEAAVEAKAAVEDDNE